MDTVVLCSRQNILTFVRILMRKKKNASVHSQEIHSVAGERKVVIWNASKAVLEWCIRELSRKVKAVNAVGCLSKGKWCWRTLIGMGKCSETSSGDNKAQRKQYVIDSIFKMHTYNSPEGPPKIWTKGLPCCWDLGWIFFLCSRF